MHTLLVSGVTKSVPPLTPVVTPLLLVVIIQVIGHCADCE